MLKYNNSITKLELGGSLIGDEGGKALAEILKYNNSITAIALGGNCIRIEGVKALAEVIKYNNSITYLQLGMNWIGLEGAKILIEAFKYNNSITYLDILSGGENIGATEFNIIREFEQRNKKLAEQKALTLNQEGNDLFSKGAYGRAIEKYNEAFKITGNNAYKEHIAIAEKQQAAILAELIEADNITEAQKLIVQMSIAGLSKVDNNGDTALNCAASKGLDKVCELLIPKMSSQAINHSNNKDEMALAWAALKGLDKVCEMLIPKMNEQAINHINEDGNTALIFAADRGLDKVCEMLIPKMSKDAINQVNNKGGTALTWITKKQLELEAKRQAEIKKQQAELEAKRQAEFIKKQQQELEIKRIELAKQAELQAKQQVELLLLKQQLELSAKQTELAKQAELQAKQQTELLLLKQQLELEAKQAEVAKKQQTEQQAELIKKQQQEEVITIQRKELVLLRQQQQELERKLQTELAKKQQQAEATILSLKQQLESVNQQVELIAKQQVAQTAHKGEGVKLSALTKNTTSTVSSPKKVDEPTQELAILQEKIKEKTVKIEASTSIRPQDKEAMHQKINSIANKATMIANKNSMQKIVDEMDKIINENRVTKGGLSDLEGNVDKILESQKYLIRKGTVKPATFQKTLIEVKTKIENDSTINLKNKSTMKICLDTVRDKTLKLQDKSSIEQITENMRNILSKDIITKGMLDDLVDDIKQVEQQNSIMDNNLKVNIVNKIIYDNPLLNHPELLQPAMEKFSLKEIGERIDELSPSLINTAINTKDANLILAGLMSVADANEQQALKYAAEGEALSNGIRRSEILFPEIDKHNNYTSTELILNDLVSLVGNIEEAPAG